MYFAGRSRGVKVQWGYLQEKNENSRHLCVIIHLGKISSEALEKER